MDDPKSTVTTNTRSRAQSLGGRRSNTRNASRSLTRVHSAQAFDDHSTYHESDDTPVAIDPEKEDIMFEKHSHGLEESDEVHEKFEKESADGTAEAREGTSDVDDIELAKAAKIPSQRPARDPYLVEWQGPDDPEFPKNWSMKKRWMATFVVSCFTFISPVSSSITAPALSSLGKDLHITNEVELELTFSIFVLAYAFGPLFFGPLSEVFGRVRVLQFGNLFYLAWNIGCGFAQTKTQMIVFRFLAGLGGSTPQSVGGGVLSDCFRPEERGKAISIYAMAPLLGPAIGPICGGFIAQYSTWRWAFWSTSIATVVIQIFGFIFLQETYTPVLLKRKAAKLRKETGDDRYYTEYDHEDHKLVKKLSIAVQRPFILLFTQPIIQVIAVYMAYVYGLMYLIIASFPTLWTVAYHESISIAGLNYISMGLGFGISTQISARMIDYFYRKLKKRNNNVGKPEFRVPMMYPASLVVPISLFWYGWSAQAHVHWIMPNIGIFLFSASSIISFQCLQSYIIDSYTRYAASGLAAAVFLRALAGFGFPLFASYMYDALGYGWGNSLLAFISTVLGIPAPFLFRKYGQMLREKSPYAAGGEQL